MPIHKSKDRTPDLVKAVKSLTQRHVLVGVPAAGKERAKAPGDENEDGGLTNAQIGYIMEYGAPEANIPPRPHLIPGVESVRAEVAERYKAAGEKALSGDVEAVNKAHHAVGLLGQNAVRARITSGPFVPLSPRTIAERKKRGRKGKKPLIDTGQYRRAHTYVVRNRGE